MPRGRGAGPAGRRGSPRPGSAVPLGSLYALMGLPAEVPLLEAVRRAADHRWLRFMAFTDWFHHDTSDVAFAVLVADRTRVAVPAATDTEADRGDLG
ncbi:DUF6183 family protein [Streptomyces sp. NPDC029041]|uniref:DUF6183 family protein n=1 Tax=Streptomyces sp. NPDC029041 TaxID=3155727 RepID=UPI0033F36116